MNKKIRYLILFFFIIGCSLDNKTGLWSKSKKIEKDPVIKEIFKKKEKLSKEFNPNIRINLKSSYKKNSFINNLNNNNGQINFDGNLKKVSKYKFSKIDKFKFVQPELLFTKDGSLVFFDNKGAIIKFDKNSKKIWKKNYYNKSEKKLNPILFFESKATTLIVADNLANYFAIDLQQGEILWKKQSSAPFNSQVKIYKDRFFVVDFDNVLRCISINDGKEIWNYKTEKSFIKSQQKLSIVISKDRVIYVNTLGDVTALNLNNGDLIWQTPTQSNIIYESSFRLKNSDLVLSNGFVYLSNNNNELFALDYKNGFIRWKQNINSSLRPTIVENILFTITQEGYLILVDSKKGNIIRITYIFENIKNAEKKNIKPTGFIVGKNNIYLSLNNGRMIIINLADGKTSDTVKIDGNKISRPYVFDKKMYVIKDNAILKIN